MYYNPETGEYNASPHIPNVAAGHAERISAGWLPVVDHKEPCEAYQRLVFSHAETVEGVRHRYYVPEHRTDAEVARLRWQMHHDMDGSDPLFFKAERDEATKQAWLDRVAEIEAALPYAGE